jgi:hypothetical protein
MIIGALFCYKKKELKRFFSFSIVWDLMVRQKIGHQPKHQKGIHTYRDFHRSFRFRDSFDASLTIIASRYETLILFLFVHRKLSSLPAIK